MALFKKISDALKKTRDGFKSKMDYLFTKNEINEDFYEELQDILISSDVGVSASEEVVSRLRNAIKQKKIKIAENAKQELRNILIEIFDELKQVSFSYPAVVTIVGVNGVGKTTSIGKLANFFKEQKKEVTLVAGDTFRAAASEQLTEWANRNKVKIIKQGEGADPASVVFDAITSAKSKKTDVLIVDTAGRLHTKQNLMAELGKIDRIINREYENASKYNLIVLDATTGQNALSQVKAFDEFCHIDGIVLTKLDGTAKGGMAIAIALDLGLPVVFIGTGEKLEDISEFNSKEFVNNLF